MSARNRRRRPAPIEEATKAARLVERLAGKYEGDYRWLHASGYGKPQRKAGDAVSDPPALMTGTAATVRHYMTRASEDLDDALDATQRANYWLTRVGVVIDRTASAGGEDPDLQTASAADVRQARQAQERRNARAEAARRNGDPWPYTEVTG